MLPGSVQRGAENRAPVGGELGRACAQGSFLVPAMSPGPDTEVTGLSPSGT